MWCRSLPFQLCFLQSNRLVPGLEYNAHWQYSTFSVSYMHYININYNNNNVHVIWYRCQDHWLLLCTHLSTFHRHVLIRRRCRSLAALIEFLILLMNHDYKSFCYNTALWNFSSIVLVMRGFICMYIKSIISAHRGQCRQCSLEHRKNSHNTRR